jgi:hypothetical protein
LRRASKTPASQTTTLPAWKTRPSISGAIVMMIGMACAGNGGSAVGAGVQPGGAAECRYTSPRLRLSRLTRSHRRRDIRFGSRPRRLMSRRAIVCRGSLVRSASATYLGAGRPFWFPMGRIRRLCKCGGRGFALAESAYVARSHVVEVCIRPRMRSSHDVSLQRHKRCEPCLASHWI